MYAEINVRFTVSVDHSKTLSLATLLESLSELKLEAAILNFLIKDSQTTSYVNCTTTGALQAVEANATGLAPVDEADTRDQAITR